MVKIVCFYIDGTYDEYERSFPGGVRYAVSNLMERIKYLSKNDPGYFVYDNRDFAIVEPEVCFLYEALQLGDTIVNIAGFIK